MCAVLNAEIKNEIIRRFYSGQSLRSIAGELHLSRKTVRRMIDEHCQDRQRGAINSDLPAPRQKRPSQLHAYDETLREYLGRDPNNSTRRSDALNKTASLTWNS